MVIMEYSDAFGMEYFKKYLLYVIRSLISTEKTDSFLVVYNIIMEKKELDYSMYCYFFFPLAFPLAVGVFFVTFFFAAFFAILLSFI
jgi:hypothetical protein